MPGILLGRKTTRWVLHKRPGFREFFHLAVSGLIWQAKSTSPWLPRFGILVLHSPPERENAAKETRPCSNATSSTALRKSRKHLDAPPKPSGDGPRTASNANRAPFVCKPAASVAATSQPANRSPIS